MTDPAALRVALYGGPLDGRTLSVLVPVGRDGDVVLPDEVHVPVLRPDRAARWLADGEDGGAVPAAVYGVAVYRSRRPGGLVPVSPSDGSVRFTFDHEEDYDEGQGTT